MQVGYATYKQNGNTITHFKMFGLKLASFNDIKCQSSLKFE